MKATKIRRMKTPLSQSSNIAIGQRLIALREALPYESAADFCRDVGIAPNTLNNYESGLRRPSLDEANKIRTRLAVPLDYIYHGDESGLPKRVADALATRRRALTSDES